jgi:hypothetical protein
MTWKEWTTVLVPVLKTCLLRASMASTFPQIILFGPTKYQGRGLEHPWYNQELQKIQVLWEAASYPTLVAEMVQPCFELLRMELGVPDDITEVSFARMGRATTKTWIKTVWRSAIKLGFQIHDSYARPQLMRANDCFLMRVFEGREDYSPGQLKMLNEVRMFQEVITMSDITTACGKNLLMDAYNGTLKESNLHHYSWPKKQSSLSPSHWALWKQALEECFVEYPHSTTKKVLIAPLGKWFKHVGKHWKWWYDPDTNSLFHKEGPFFLKYSSNREMLGSTFTETTFNCNPPDHACLASVT